MRPEQIGVLAALAVSLAVAVGCTLSTVRAWRWPADDGSHNLARWYHHNYRVLGWPFRNGMSVIPVGAAFGYLIAAAIVTAEYVRPAADLGGLLALALLLVVAYALVAMIKPVGWMKPRWLREADRGTR